MENEDWIFDYEYHKVEDIDLDHLTNLFLKMKDFHEWHLCVLNQSLSRTVNNINSTAEACDWIHWARMDLSRSIDTIIQFHLDNENYEIIPKIKNHLSKLRAHALEIEMNLEKFI